MPRDWRPPVLETARLILRPVEESDAESIFDYARNPNVTRYTLWDAHPDISATQAFIREYALAQYLEGMPDPYCICWKSDPQRVLGTLGARWQTRAHRAMEMGFALGEPHWGQGIVVEAARALLKFLFDTYVVERVHAHCFAPNVASARVMHKLGMTFEGCLRSALFHREQYWDLHVFSMLRREWE